MATYRAYQIDEDGRTLTEPKTFEASSDLEAIVLAMQLADRLAMEVWDETRRVGVVGLQRPPQGGAKATFPSLGIKSAPSRL